VVGVFMYNRHITVEYDAKWWRGQVGAGHSWSDIAVPTHYQMSLDKLNRVLEVHPHRRVVVVQVCIGLYAFSLHWFRWLSEVVSNLGWHSFDRLV
jgi:hypothetical protein